MFVCLVALVAASNNDLDKLIKLTTGICNKHPSWSLGSPACQWDGFSCNSTGFVTRVSLARKGYTGILNLANLPEGVTQVDFSYNTLTGELDMRSLPRTLSYLDVSNNNFGGQLDLTFLPESLQYLHLENNAFCGSAPLKCPKSLTPWTDGMDGMCNGAAPVGSCAEGALTCQPCAALTADLGKLLKLTASMGGVCADDTWKSTVPPCAPSSGWAGVACNSGGVVTQLRFQSHKPPLTGSVDMANLPDSVQIVDLSGNALSGDLDLSNLPGTLEYLSVASNRFGGALNLAALPSSLQYLYLDNNNFCGTSPLKCPAALGDGLSSGGMCGGADARGDCTTGALQCDTACAPLPPSGGSPKAFGAIAVAAVVLLGAAIVGLVLVRMRRRMSYLQIGSSGATAPLIP